MRCAEIKSIPVTARRTKGERMKTKYIAAVATMGLTLAMGWSCMAGPSLAAVTPMPVRVTTAPVVVVPVGYVWDGSEYVGQVGGSYYYLGPHNTWVELDQTRQHRFEDWQKKNPDWRTREVKNTHYQGHDMRQSHPVPAPNLPPGDHPHSP
jgi:hypothetical protein